MTTDTIAGQDLSLGATRGDGGTRFRVWAPKPESVTLAVQQDGHERRYVMDGDASGYREITLPGVGAGARYGYVLDGDGPFPDPCSRSQPDGVHSLSEVVDAEWFVWTDG